MIVELPTDRIDLRADARSIDGATVSGLVESISEVGLINPIRVRAVGDRWELIAGAHRLAACKQLGLAVIDAVVVEDDDLRAELAMIDENLCRAELSPADRAGQTARRKTIYEALHPTTVHGANLEGAGVANFATPEAERFTSATAKVTGQSERAVQLHAERGNKIVPSVLAMIKGTTLDTGTYLDKLKKMSGGDQMQAAKRDLAHERQKAKSGIHRRVRSVSAPLTEEEVREKQVEALMAAWNKASAEARQEFLDRIDTPVFDRSAA